MRYVAICGVWIFWFVLATALVTTAAAGATYEPMDFVTHQVRVLFPSQEPAADTTVTLRSMARNMLRGFSGYDLEAVVTDAEGQAVLRYPKRIESSKGTNFGFSVSPVYATVEPAADHAGAIILLDAVSPGAPFAIQIVRGYTLHGKMETVDGDPVSSLPVMINHDLHAETHTGAGGEIWKRETVTDADGNFLFTHVNPAAVSITPKWFTTSYWSNTIVNGRPAHDRIDRFQPKWNNLENNIIIQTSPSPAKVYQGIAVGADGNPVADARVTIGYSWHRGRDNGRSWETTQTLSDGTWRLEIPTKWVTWGEIRQPGPPGPTTGTAHIAARGVINLSITASQVVRLLPNTSDELMPASN